MKLYYKFLAWVLPKFIAFNKLFQSEIAVAIHLFIFYFIYLKKKNLKEKIRKM